MTTITHPQGTRFQTPQPASRRKAAACSAVPVVSPSDGWLDRLAAWTERQPSHHHFGHWISLR